MRIHNRYVWGAGNAGILELCLHVLNKVETGVDSNCSVFGGVIGIHLRGSPENAALQICGFTCSEYNLLVVQLKTPISNKILRAK